MGISGQWYEQLHSNLAMADVDETYSRPRHRKPEYDNGKKIPVKNQDKDIGKSNIISKLHH